MPKIEKEWGTVLYVDDQKVRDQVFERVLNYFKEHEAFSGEVVMQNDACIIEAPEVFAEIADEIINFKFREVK